MSLFTHSGIVFTVVATLVLNLSAHAATPTNSAGSQDPKGPKAGQEWGTEASSGVKIYYSGTQDEYGRPGVLKYDNVIKRLVHGSISGNSVAWEVPQGGFNAAPTPSEINGRRVYYPNSNYPETKSETKEAIPRSRSLVVIDEESGKRQNLSPRGSGQAEISNSYPERIAQTKTWQEMKADGVEERFRPSRLDKPTAAAKATKEWMSTEVEKLIAGRPNALVGDQTTPEKLKMSDRVGPLIEMSRGAAGYYMAMGLMAGLVLYTDYANNPAAWDAYLRSSIDPSSIAQLVTFMGIAGVSYYVYKHDTRVMFGEAALAKGGVQSALYGGSLMTAVLMTTVLGEMMADPDSMKCIGATAYKETGVWKRDLAACDKFFTTWQTNARWNKLATEQLMPVIANFIVAGGILKAAGLGMRWALSRQVIATAVTRLSFAFNARAGGWVGFAGGAAVQFLLFYGAYQISDKIFGVGQWTREFFTADWSFSNDPLGKSLTEVETNLYSEWKRLKESDFKPFEVPTGDFRPTNLDYQKLLDKYGEMSDNWRSIQMADTNGALQQWSIKAFNYYAMADVASSFYLAAAPRLAFNRDNTDVAARKENGFTREWVDRYFADQEKAASGNWKIVKDMNFAGTWKYVATYNVKDYLLTSMACGPEAEGYKDSRSNLTKTISGFWSSWVSGNTAPRDVVSDTKGFALAFNPPRIVRPLPGNQSSVCEDLGGWTKTLIPWSSAPVMPNALVVSEGSATYTNLVDYISGEVRPSFLMGQSSAPVVERSAAPKQDNQWWKYRIASRTAQVEKQLRKDYEDMLNGVYKKALTNTEYRACTPSEVANPDLEIALRGFTMSDDTCPSDATHRLARGVLNSLRDEMRLYMALLVDLHHSKADVIGPAVEKEADGGAMTVANGSLYLLTLFDQILKGATAVNPKDRADIAKISKDFQDASEVQKKYLYAPKTNEIPDFVKEMTGDLKDAQTALQAKMTEMQAVYKSEGESSRRLQILRMESQFMGQAIDVKIDDLRKLHRSLAPEAHIEEWAYDLGTRIDGTFTKALVLYNILTTFEAPKL